jgi:hypothetical protein
MSDLNELIEANRELIERSLDLSIGSHLRIEAQLMLTIKPEDRDHVAISANGMTNRCGGRYSDALWTAASDYHRDPVKWRAERDADVAKRLAAQAEQRAAAAAILSECQRNRKARLAAAADQSA